ncbi:MAG: TolC family protein, partial [Kordiimonas sp.]
MYKILSIVLATLLLSPSISASGNSLSLQQAVERALASNDPYLQEASQRASSLEEKAVADAQLADPKLRINFANWPTNSFRYTQEPMTQVQLGLTQAFPKGDTLKFSRQKRQAEARGLHHLKNLRQREIILDTRLLWLDLFYASNARLKVSASQKAVTDLIGIIEGKYATGQGTQQNVARTQLELSLLDDRLAEVDQSISILRAKLARRIGKEALIVSMPSHLPALQHPSSLSVIEEVLAQHPAANVLAAKIETASKEGSIAGEQYKPGWSLNVGYGARGGNRADFVFVVVL